MINRISFEYVAELFYFKKERRRKIPTQIMHHFSTIMDGPTENKQTHTRRVPW